MHNFLLQVIEETLLKMQKRIDSLYLVEKEAVEIQALVIQKKEETAFADKMDKINLALL